MTDQSEIVLKGAKCDYRSPAQSLLNERPKTLCSYCPLARWYKRTTWYCFCSEFKTISYDQAAKLTTAVQACDARELEIIRLNAEATRG